MLYAINGGSGQRPFRSIENVIKWINVDKVAHEGMSPPDILGDAAKLDGIKSNSIDYFVYQHCLEHEGCGEGEGLIAEAYRVLKPGGSLLVTVPDMRALASAWLSGRMNTQLYFTNAYGAYMGHDEDRHRWGYDEASLRQFISKCANWQWVGRFNWRSISAMDLSRDWWILDVEAVK